MSALNCRAILDSNGMVFKDEETTMSFGGKIIPKDGHSDGSRVRMYVKANTQTEFHGALTIPTLKGQQWDKHSFGEAYLFAQAHDAYYGAKVVETPVCPPEELAIWGGEFEGDEEEIEDEEGYLEIALPKGRRFYKNYIMKPRESKEFLKKQPKPEQWAVKECTDEECRKHKHVHVVSGRYMHVWQKPTPAGVELIPLAPPINLAVKGRALAVDKNCLLSSIKASVDVHRQACVERGVEVEGKVKKVSASVEPIAEPLDFCAEGGDEVADDSFYGKVYATALAAAKDLAQKGTYEDLVTVIRVAGNVPWRKLDRIAPTSSGQAKLRKTLGGIFSSHILPLAQINVEGVRGSPLREFFAACSAKAKPFGDRNKDAIFGYLLSRLAEPIHNIRTIDGRACVVSPEECSGYTEEASNEGDGYDF